MTTSHISSWGPPLLSSMQSCPSSWACWWQGGRTLGVLREIQKLGCLSTAAPPAARGAGIPHEPSPYFFCFILFPFCYSDWVTSSILVFPITGLFLFCFCFPAFSDLLLVPTSVFFISVNEFKIVKSFFFLSSSPLVKEAYNSLSLLLILSPNSSSFLLNLISILWFLLWNLYPINFISSSLSSFFFFLLF